MANYCPFCGSAVDPQARFCGKCGKEILQEPVQNVSPSEAHGPWEEISLPPLPAYPDIPVINDLPFPNIPEGIAVPPPNQMGLNYAVPIRNALNTAVSAVHRAVQPQMNQPEKKKGSILPILLLAGGICLAVWFFFLKPKEPTVYSPGSGTQPSLPVQSAIPETPVPSVSQGTTGFEQLGLAADAQVNTDYRYPAIFTDGDSETVYGTVRFTNYTRSPVDQAQLDFGRENQMDLTGYDLCVLESAVTFDGSEARDRNLSIRRMMTNYYDVYTYDDSFEAFTDSYGEEYTRFTVNYNGQERYIYLWDSNEWRLLDNGAQYTESITFLIPGGYDGVVHGFVNPKRNGFEELGNPEDVVAFRLR